MKPKKKPAESGRKKSTILPGREVKRLTLRAEKRFVDSAARFARDRNISLSALVENYFRTLHDLERFPYLEMPSSKSLKGVLRDSKLTRDHYIRYLEKKYE